MGKLMFLEDLRPEPAGGRAGEPVPEISGNECFAMIDGCCYKIEDGCLMKVPWYTSLIMKYLGI